MSSRLSAHFCQLTLKQTGHLTPRLRCKGNSVNMLELLQEHKDHIDLSQLFWVSGIQSPYSASWNGTVTRCKHPAVIQFHRTYTDLMSRKKIVL